MIRLRLPQLTKFARNNVNKTSCRQAMEFGIRRNSTEGLSVVARYLTLVFCWFGIINPSGHCQAQTGVIDHSALALVPGLDESELHSLQQFPEWNPDLAAILKSLGRMHLFTPNQIARYPLMETNLAEQSKELFARVRVRGTVQRIRLHQLSKVAEATFGFPNYFVIDIQTEQGPVIKICTRVIPALMRQQINRGVDACAGESVAADAFVIYSIMQEGGREDSEPSKSLVCVAPRLAWYPGQDSASRGLETNRGCLLLASQGFDIGQLDTVRQARGNELLPGDRDIMLPMLKACQQIATSESASRRAAEAAQPLDIRFLFEQSDAARGDLFRITAQLHRVTEIRMDDGAVYYQLDLFVPLRNKLRLTAAGRGAA